MHARHLWDPIAVSYARKSATCRDYIVPDQLLPHRTVHACLHRNPRTFDPKLQGQGPESWISVIHPKSAWIGRISLSIRFALALHENTPATLEAKIDAVAVFDPVLASLTQRRPAKRSRRAETWALGRNGRNGCKGRNAGLQDFVLLQGRLRNSLLFYLSRGSAMPRW